MDTSRLNQIEANVVIVLTSNMNIMGEVIPLWECTNTVEELTSMAVQFTLQFVEKIGGGSASYIIHDFRNEGN